MLKRHGFNETRPAVRHMVGMKVQRDNGDTHHALGLGPEVGLVAIAETAVVETSCFLRGVPMVLLGLFV